MSVYITDIYIESMWGDTTLQWNNIDRNVNIVVGQNGFGKSTMLNLIRAVLTKDENLSQLHLSVISVLLTNLRQRNRRFLNSE